MIRINLLPDNVRKGRGPAKPGAKGGAPEGGGGMAVVVLLALVLFGTAGGLGFMSLSSVNAQQKILAEKKSELAEIEKKISSLSEKAKDIQRLMETFIKQYEVLQALDPPDQIIWSEKINMLANLMPAEVFLSDMEITEQTVEVQTQASINAQLEWEKGGKQGVAPEIVKRPVVTYTLKMTGLADGEDSTKQFANVLKFEKILHDYTTTDNQGKERKFLDYFNTEIGIDFIEATMFLNQYPVNQFVFVLRTLPPPVVEVSPGEAAAAATKQVSSAR